LHTNHALPRKGQFGMFVTDWLKLVLLSIFWGAAFYFSEVALDHAGPLTIVMARVSLAAVILAVYCRLIGIDMTLTPALVGAFLVMGFINNVIPFSLITLGQTQITGSLAAILNATTRRRCSPSPLPISGHEGKKPRHSNWRASSPVWAVLSSSSA